MIRSILLAALVALPYPVLAASPAALEMAEVQKTFTAKQAEVFERQLVTPLANYIMVASCHRGGHGMTALDEHDAYRYAENVASIYEFTLDQLVVTRRFVNEQMAADASIQVNAVTCAAFRQEMLKTGQLRVY